MVLPDIPHTSYVWLEQGPPRVILHAVATIPQLPASGYSTERHELRKAVADVVGHRIQIDDWVIHWTDGDA
jgi:hypothetical protein